MAITNVSVSLSYEEYHMLLDALGDKRYAVQSRLDEIEEASESYVISAGGSAIDMVEEYEKDLTVLTSLECKIKKASRPGGLE